VCASRRDVSVQSPTTLSSSHQRAHLHTRPQTSPQPVGQTVGELLEDPTMCAPPVVMCLFSPLPP
jgi:hypothetical protein